MGSTLKYDLKSGANKLAVILGFVNMFFLVLTVCFLAGFIIAIIMEPQKVDNWLNFPLKAVVLWYLGIAGSNLLTAIVAVSTAAWAVVWSIQKYRSL